MSEFESAETVGQGLVDAARSLAPIISRFESEIEDARQMPADLVDALEDAGVFSTFRPRALGGLEVEPVEWLEMVEELSCMNASVGWLAMVNAGMGTAYMTPELYESLSRRTGGRFIGASNFGRWAGRAKQVDGGYMISGRWPFVSGSPIATWVGGLSVLYDEQDEMVQHPDGLPWLINAIWPRDQATLIDTWDGLGLRGTGSGDMEVSDLFVPDEQVNHLGFHDRTHDGPLFRMKEALFMAHGAHALGIARCAQEAFLSQMSEKLRHGSLRQLQMGNMQGHQIAYGKADALVRAARTNLHAVVAEAYADVCAHPGELLDMPLRVQMREANVFTVRAAKEAVNTIFEMAGSSAVYRGRPIERAYRDISTAANHIIATESEFASVGSYYLTRDVDGGPVIAGRKFN